MNTMSTKYKFPAAPGSGATAVILALTDQAALTARRISLILRSSHDSAALGLTFEALLDGGTTYRAFTAATHLAATAADPTWTYFIAVPIGIVGLKINYVNSANVLTSWEGSIALIYDEQAAP